MNRFFIRTRFIFFALMGLALIADPVDIRAEVLNKIAAVVNDEIITTYELQKEIATRIAAEGRDTPPAKEMAALRRETLDRMIEQSLVHQRVRDLGISVTDEELEAAIDDVLKQNQITREQLLQALSAQGMGFTAYREKLRQQILRYKLIGREVQSKVDVTTQEIRDYFRQHIDEYRSEPTVTLSYINFEIPRDESISNTQVSEIRSRAQEALSLLEQGEEFYSTLFIYTTDPHVDGGELGTFTLEELSPAFSRAIANLEEGQVTNLVETPEGLFILRVDSRDPGPVRKFDTVKEEIKQRLLEQDRDERFREWSTDLKKDAYIDIRI